MEEDARGLTSSTVRGMHMRYSFTSMTSAQRQSFSKFSRKDTTYQCEEYRPIFSQKILISVIVDPNLREKKVACYKVSECIKMLPLDDVSTTRPDGQQTSVAYKVS